MIGIQNDVGELLLSPESRPTARATFSDPSMPIWTAAICRSALSSPESLRDQLGLTASTRLTPAVDWTVKAVMQATP